MPIDLIEEQPHPYLSTEVTLHGVLVELYGLGVLILGESGIGKSECALDLVTRGHRLVADDMVLLTLIGQSLHGRSPDLTFELLEIRGFGIVNIRELYGASAVCQSVGVSICVELRRWEEVESIERLGPETQSTTLLGVPVPKFEIPVRPGRNLSTLLETAARIFKLSHAGNITAGKLTKDHTELLNRTH
ncbi:MAG: hypothetical protein ACT4O9_04950 [Blastocatellia bacterium]